MLDITYSLKPSNDSLTSSAEFPKPNYHSISILTKQKKYLQLSDQNKSYLEGHYSTRFRRIRKTLALFFTVAVAIIILLLLFLERKKSMFSEFFENYISPQYVTAVTIILVASIVLIFTLRLIKVYISELEDQSFSLQNLGDRLNTFFESTSDLIYELDADSRYIHVNKTVEKVLGLSIDQLKEKSCWDFVPKEYLNETRKYYIEHVKSRKKSSYYEFPIKDAEGNLMWLGQSVDYKYDGNKAIRAYAIAKDITPQKKIAKKKERYEKGLRLLNELGAKSSKDYLELISDGLKLCADFLDLDIGIVSKVEGDTYTIVDFIPSNAGLERGQSFELGGTYCDITLKAEKTIAIDEMSTSMYSAHPCFKNFNLESYIGASYSVNEHVRGTVNFTSPDPRRKLFTEYDIDFVTLVARWVGTLIENHESRQRMVEQQNITETFVSSAPAAIAMFDKDVKYIAASEKWYKDYSISHEIIGKSHYEIFPEIGDEWKEVHQRAINGETINREEDSFVRADGSIQWMKWEVSPWYSMENEVGGFILFTEDVTNQRQQREDLLVANQEQDNLVAVIAHDLKSPLNQILGMSDLLKNYVNDEGIAINEMIKKVSSDGNEMIEQLVQLKYLEKSLFKESEFSLKLFFENKIKLFQEIAENKNIQLKGDTSLANDAIVGHEESIGRIIDNLLSNALKFSPKGGKVCFGLYSCNKELVITVEDSGAGFSEEDKKKVFQKFQKLSTRPTGGETSSGLGLSIVDTLVQKLNGKVVLESKKGEGAKFTVKIPIS